MIKNYEWLFPTKIRYGEGCLGELGDIVKDFGKENILIVTDKGVEAAGLVDLVINELNKAGFDKINIFDNVVPNPRDTACDEGAEFAKKVGADIVIAVGGGSPIDTAKMIAMLMTNEGKTLDYEGFFKVKNELPPFITIPTTVGTGSEVTEWAVITDLKRMFKMSVADTKLYPDIALLDPIMVKNLPPRVVASTGMDALSHAIESYTCRVATPIADAIALYAIELIGKNIRFAVYGGEAGYEARANMLLGSLMAGVALSQADVAGVHCMGEALGGLYDMPHGIANASILPYMMLYCAVANEEKFARVAECLGVDTKGMTQTEAARAAAYAVKELNDDLMVPSIKDAGAKPEDFEYLSQKAEANMSNPDNARDAVAADYYKLFVKAYNGEM